MSIQQFLNKSNRFFRYAVSCSESDLLSNCGEFLGEDLFLRLNNGEFMIFCLSEGEVGPGLESLRLQTNTGTLEWCRM